MPYTVAGIIDINSGGTPFDELALKVYSGMVLAAYNKAITTQGRHIERMIDSGKSAQFPVLGRLGSGFHTRGDEVTFQSMNNNEHVISIQNLLVSAVFVDNLDEAKAHYDTRAEIATQQGQQLAEQADKNVLRAFISASETATPGFTGGDTTTNVTNALMATDASVLKAGIYDAAEQLDDNSIPGTERFFWLKPAQFYLLLQDGEFLDRDFGGDGSRATAVMRNAADFMIVKTTNMPSANDSANDDIPTRLKMDYSNTVAVGGHRSAAGSVTLIGLGFEQEYLPVRQGTALIAKYAKGFDYLRPEAAVALQTA